MEDGTPQETTPLTLEDLLSIEANRERWESLLKAEALVPFIGAGLSRFQEDAQGKYVYPGWGAFLRGFRYKRAEKQALEKLLAANQYEAAASFAHSTLGETVFRKGVQNTFRPERLEGIDLKEVHRLLPQRFAHLILTTNLDEVLEKTWKEANIELPRITPNHADEYQKALSKKGNTLVKLHGTVSESTQWVLTQEQYTDLYGSAGQPDMDKIFPKQLGQALQSKTLFFIGASLDKDRTLEVLHEIVLKHKYTEHFAILHLPEMETEEQKEAWLDRDRELENDYGISTLWFPKGRYESIALFLQALPLANRPDPKIYAFGQVFEKLPKPKADTNTSTKSAMRFWYKAGTVQYVPREEEEARLRDFCEEESNTRWMGITGPGGSGKSRLAWEFIQQQDKKSDWTCRFLDWKHFEIKTLGPWQHDKNTLVVIDYVNSIAEEVGAWLRELVETEGQREHKFRVLLLEREGNKKSTTGGIEAPQWYERMMVGSDRSQEVANKEYHKGLLELEAMPQKRSRRVAGNYLQQQYGTSLSDEAWDIIYKLLVEVDREKQRPIFILFVTDAWKADPANLKNWDKTMLHEWINQQEVKKIGKYFNEQPAITKDYMDLLAVATMVGDLDLSIDLPAGFKTKVDRINAFIKGKHRPLKQLLLDLGWTNAGYEAIISSVVPDLLGEYFALQRVEAWAGDPGSSLIEQLRDWAWEQQTKNYFSFLFRMIQGYPEHLLLNDLVGWDGDWNEKLDRRKSFLLINFSAYNQPVKSKKVLYGYTDKVGHKNPSIEVDENLAQALLNLAIQQNLEGIEQTISQMQKLSDRHNYHLGIDQELAKVLVFLTSKQNLGGIEQTISELQKLSDGHDNSLEIDLEFARALCNLTNKQELEGIEQTISQLQKLSDRHSSHQKIELVLAKALVNKTVKQDLDSIEQTIYQLQILSNRHDCDPEIDLRLAEALFNKTIEQDIGAIEQTISRLKKLSAHHDSYPKIDLRLAKAMVNKTIKQDPSGIRQTVSQLQKLSSRYQNQYRFEIEVMIGLWNLSEQQNPKDVIKTANRLNDRIQEIKTGKEALILLLEEEDKYIAAMKTVEEKQRALLIFTKLFEINPELTEVKDFLDRHLPPKQ